MKRVAYSVETKNKVIEMKIKECSTREIMDQLNIRSKTQVDNWWKWYRNGETHRFNQQIGKQYSYGKDKEELSSEEALKLKLKRLEIENDILKKYKALERKWSQK